ncbi:MAG: Uma2 family endonuclease, partial [Saprospiraceae bacterium]
MEVLQKKLTYQEFKQIEFDDSDDSWYELINGELVKKQSPTISHQRISRKIERSLEDYALKTQSGEMFHAPLDVVLDDNNAYQPDIFFIKKDRFFILDEKEQVVIGAPDLVVEILSKGTAIYDKGDKKDIYEMNGVREYWLVEPRNMSVEVYALKNERYRLVAYLEETGIVK